MQNGYRTLIDQTPKTLSAVDNLFSDNSDTMVQLLASLATTSQMLYVRTPAINAFFPNYRGSTFGAVADTMRDNGIWVTADLYPRYRPAMTRLVHHREPISERRPTRRPRAGSRFRRPRVVRRCLSNLRGDRDARLEW
ncbi:Mce family protein Mce5F [Mycobacteroides abscessus subsp. abscessus]|nr:Mce family protein Mce5F [Mycobacteroides abscessus subsp. abscessus]